jgi:hypothetical protein
MARLFNVLGYFIITPARLKTGIITILSLLIVLAAKTNFFSKICPSS